MAHIKRVQFHFVILIKTMTMHLTSTFVVAFWLLLLTIFQAQGNLNEILIKRLLFCFFFTYFFRNIFGFFSGFCFFGFFMAKAWLRWPEANLNWVPLFAILFCIRSYEQNRARLSRVASCKNLTVNIKQVSQRVCCGVHSTSKNKYLDWVE